MRRDMVILRTQLLERHRKQLVLGRVHFYERIGVHFLTGAKLMRGEPVNLQTAKRIASVLGIEVQSLIKSWCEHERLANNTTGG